MSEAMSSLSRSEVWTMSNTILTLRAIDEPKKRLERYATSLTPFLLLCTTAAGGILQAIDEGPPPHSDFSHIVFNVTLLLKIRQKMALQF